MTPVKRKAPAGTGADAKATGQVPTSISRAADESAFCGDCGNPWLKRLGVCLGCGRAMPMRFLARRGLGRPYWTPVAGVAS